ncbi:hypothetical protein V5O48_005214 [Marasmius crinis-equi]|uniref:Uncharacterized protein n=1 Tax=Marasmius crinis-equi TaxID=585013 RepID=A0ABR3FNX4_9AGAR
MTPLYTLVITYLVAFTVASPFKVARQATCDVDQIGADVQHIHDNTVTLDNDVLAIPDSGATPAQALAVHGDIQNIASAIDSTTTVIEPCPTFPDDAFKAILDEVQDIVNIETKAMNDLSAKRGAFDASTVSLIRQDLVDLRTASVNLENVWLAKAPADLLPQAQDLADAINNALDSALNAYA